MAKQQETVEKALEITRELLTNSQMGKEPKTPEVIDPGIELARKALGGAIEDFATVLCAVSVLCALDPSTGLMILLTAQGLRENPLVQKAQIELRQERDLLSADVKAVA